jgi:hypothetical protein
MRELHADVARSTPHCAASSGAVFGARDKPRQDSFTDTQKSRPPKSCFTAPGEKTFPWF